MHVWFITGASSGFGALIAREALAAGDAVVATARNPRSIQAYLGTHPYLMPLALDVTQEAQAQAAAAVERFGPSMCCSTTLGSDCSGLWRKQPTRK